MSETKDVLILAIESSCDETAAAVVKNGREVLSNVISSQIALHTLYGGVVPEIASRKHVERINQVIKEREGRTAKEASLCHTSDIIRIYGRLQSRRYTKLTADGPEERTAYEISALTAEIPDTVF